MNKKETVDSMLLSITEKYKKEFTNSFDGSNRTGTRNNNVVVLTELGEKLSNEISNTTKEYYKENGTSDKPRIDELNRTLYIGFIEFGAAYETN